MPIPALPPRLASLLAAMAWALATFSAAPVAAATPEGVSVGGCEVLASGQLRTSDYVYRYEGGCKNGLADGQGTATWQLRHATSAPPVMWQGRFSQGIFLADKASVGAKRINSTQVLLDLGPLPAPKGAQTGRLWVESRIDGKLPASACQPLSLQVSATGNLADDALAKAWLDQAYERWLAVCHQAGVDALSGRYLPTRLHQGSDWAIDSYGNIPGGVVQASKHFRQTATGKAPEWESYRNQAAQQVASAQRDQQESAALQANKNRIYSFAKKVGANQLVTLEALDKNPFRFDNQVILIAVRMHEARTPIEAVVQPASRARNGWSRVLLRGAIAQWDEQGRIAAVRVKGRSTEEFTHGAVIVELVDSQRCDERDCEDYLLMPGKRWLRDEVFHASASPTERSTIRIAAR